MSYVISTSDSEGTPVCLGEVEWQTHILKRHPEVVVVKYVPAPEREFQQTGFVSSVYFLKELLENSQLE